MKMKRLFTLVLSLMMILSLSAPASAIDGENVYTKEEISSINEVTVVPTTAICLIAIAILRETWAIINPAFLHTVQSSVPRVGDTLFWLLAM